MYVWIKATTTTKYGRRDKEFGYTLHIRHRNEEAQALGSGADTQLDEPFSRRADPLGQKSRELSGLAPSGLCLYYVPSYGPIGVGSKGLLLELIDKTHHLAQEKSLSRSTGPLSVIPEYYLSNQTIISEHSS